MEDGINVSMRQYQSDSINELAGALAKAQADMTHAAKAIDNTFFKSKYADLPAVFDAARPHLAKNGLCVIQCHEIGESGKITMVSLLAHSSGQWIKSWYPINPVKADPQGLGSAISYARRYAYCSLVGVASAGEDDDGNAASGNNGKADEKPAASVFKTAAARKTFCDNVIRSFEDAQTIDDLKTLVALNGDKMQEMKTSGNEHDDLAVQELRNRYTVAMKRFTNPHVEDEVDQYANGGRVGISY